MKLHTSDFTQELKTYGKQQTVRITLKDGALIDSENINGATPSYEAKLLSSVMKGITIDSNIEIPKDTELKFEYGLLVNGSYEYINYGYYVVYNCEKKEDTSSYEITCYDKMLWSMKDYEPVDCNYPCTIDTYLKAICKKLGYTLQTTDYANKSQKLDRDYFTGIEYKYRDVLDDLAEATGSTIYIRDNGTPNLVLGQPQYIEETIDSELYPMTSLYPTAHFKSGTQKRTVEIDEENFKDTDVTFGEKYGPVNSVVLSRSAGADNVYLQDENSVAQNGVCEIKIVDNQIMNYNNRSDYLKEILDKVNGLTYYLNDFSSTGIMVLDLLDYYTARVKGKEYQCLMLNDEQDITQGLEEHIYTEKPEQSQTDYSKADKTDRKINQSYIILDKQNQRLEAVQSQIGDRSSKKTTLTQDIDGLNTTVSSVETKVEKAQSTADSATDKANNAQSTADNATDKAENAQSTADSATTKANNAQTTADNINDNLSKNYYTKKQVEETSTISQTVKGLTETAEKYEKQIDPDTGEIVAETGDLANLKITSNELSTSVTSLEKSSISNVDVEYALGTSNTTAPTSGWSAKAPDWEQGKYMWQRTKTTYANNSQKISEATCISGAKGEKGDKGSSPTLTSITNYYLAGISSTTEPTGTWVTDTTKSGFSSTNKYLWSYEVVKFSTGSTTSPKTMIGTWGEKGEKGDQGIQGIQGVKGDDGVTYYTYFAYGTDDNGTDFSKTPTSSTTYQGVCITTSSTQPTDPTKYTWYLTKGNTGDTGAKGDKGDDGITRYTYFAYGTSNSGANFSTSPTTSSTYIGICTTTSSTQPTTPSSYKWSLTKGNTGNGIKSITEYYQVSTSNKAEPTTWNTSIPTLTSTNKYLWNYEIITYTDNTTSSTSKRVIGVYGDDGTGIREIVEQYYLSSSNTEQKDGSWNTTQPTWTQGKYIWTRSKVTWTSGTTTYTTPVLANSINKANETAENANDTANDTVKNFGTYITQNAESVKLAWNQISDFIQMMIINNNVSFAILDSNQKVMMALDKTGQHFYKDDGKTVFGEMGVQKIDNQNYISFAVDGDYEKDIDNGMAWGIKTTDNKFFPILYIKDFHMGSKNGEIGTGKLVLEACDIVIDTNAGIITDNIKIHGDTMPGLFFENTDTSETLLSIIPGNNILSTYDTINILDKISFFKNQANSNTLQIGGTNGCSLTDDGSIICKTETVDGSLSCGPLACGSLLCQSLIISDGNEVSSIEANGKVVGHFNFSGLPSYQGNLLVYGEGHKYHLEWDSNKLKFYVDITNVANLSDKRLKDDIKEVPDNFIQAVGDCKTYQFKPKNRGGKIYVGLIAQELIDNYKKYKVEDYEQYGVLYESNYSSDKPDELYYFLDYEQYATIRCRYLEIKLENQQKDIDFLKEEIKKLKRGD